MKKHFSILLFSLLAVFGCAPATPELFLSDSTVAEQAIKCEKDEYKKTEYCFSPRVSKWGMPYDNHKSDVDYYFGIARHNKKAEPYIIGKFTGSEWYFLSQAVDIDGKKLNFEEMDHEVTGGIRETFSISLTKDYLKKHIKKGIKIKLYGKRGDAILDIPPAYVEGFYNYLLHN